MRKFGIVIAGFIGGVLIGGGVAAATVITSNPPSTGPQYNQGAFIGVCINPVTRAGYWETHTNFGTEASPNPAAQSNCANGYYQLVLPADPSLIPVQHQTPPSCVNVSEPPVVSTPLPDVTVTATPEPSISCK